MNPSKIDIDRNISKLRVNSSDFLNLEKSTLISMLEQTIENITSISYYWATLASEKKGILTKSKEGEEWIGGPFSCIYAIQYFIETILNEVIILFAVAGASVSGIVITKNLFRSSPLHAKERNRFNLYIGDLEKENKKLRGAVNRAKAPLTIKEFDEENPMGAISELISGLAPILPSSVRPFLNRYSSSVSAIFPLFLISSVSDAIPIFVSTIPYHLAR